jgi:hypothetical protein
MSERVDTPFVGNVATPRKLAFFRKVGAGDPMWSGSCIYGLTGATPSVSQYDADDTLSDRFSDQMPYHVRAGVVTERRLVDADEYTMTRKARVSAHLDSSPAARSFQSFGNVRWSGILEGFGLAPRPLTKRAPLVQAFNPNAFGAKELHPATQYKPFPPMGSIVPTYGEGKAL